MVGKTHRAKTGGRHQGTPNKRTQEFMDLYDSYAEQHGDPVLTLFEIQGNSELEPSLRLRAAADLLPYRHPRRKAVEIEVEDGVRIHSSVSETTKFIREALGEA